MIRSSASLAADDVSIRCRIRRSPYAANPQFEEAQEMTCTMRSWQSSKSEKDNVPVTKSSSSGSKPSEGTKQIVEGDVHHEGPELLLRSTACETSDHPLSERFQSFGSSGSLRGSSLNCKRKVWAQRSLKDKAKPLQQFTIAVHDIVVVDVHRSVDTSFLFLTTLSSGYLEFTFRTGNGHDCLVAFLTASLPRERIVSQPVYSRDALDEDPSSFDVETFTATRMQERVRTESLSEKMRRRVARVAQRIGEISTAISECACGACDPESSPSKDTSWKGDARHETRSFPSGNMEFSESHLEFSTASPMDESSALLTVVVTSSSVSHPNNNTTGLEVEQQPEEETVKK